MNTLGRYIALRLAFGWLLVFLIMTSLFSILVLVGQIDDIGKGSFQFNDAFMYVVYTLPGRVLDLAAVSSLLGSIVALGTLANSDELLAMRACGVSVFRVARIILSAGSLIMIGVLLLAQFVVPPAEQKAKINREFALAEEGSLLPTGGFWTRDSNRFINILSAKFGGVLTGVNVYEFDDQGKPTKYITAREADIDEGGRWVLHDARQITFTDQHIYDQEISSLNLDIFLNTRQVNVLSITPDMLSLDGLYQYIHVLRNRGQNTDQFVLALWQKATLPLKVAAMLLFSLPFVFGSAREANPGRRVTLGAIVGISYYYFDQALGYLGLLLSLHPAFTTLMPLAIIVLVALWLLTRIV